MKLKVIFFICLAVNIFQPFLANSQDGDNSISEKSIRVVLSEQEKAWNIGDIEAYMQGYQKSDSLKFIGKNGIQFGWQKTLDNYHKSYPDKAAMGILRFDIVKIDVLSVSSAFVIGKWALTREKGNISGYFTLLFKLIDGKWVIVCDHSS
jgi:hypothetical protein